LRGKEENQFGKYFDKLQSHSAHRTLLGPILWKITRFFKIGNEKHVKQWADYLNAFAKELIHERKQKPVQELQGKMDLLSLFINSVPDADERYLRDVVLNFMIAGRDTTAALLSWTLYELDQHPDIRDELYKELNTNIP